MKRFIAALGVAVFVAAMAVTNLTAEEKTTVTIVKTPATATATATAPVKAGSVKVTVE